MTGSLENVKFNITELEKIDDGARYKVEIEVPASFGWIERMKFITETNGIRTAHQLKHSKNENDLVYFSGIVDLKTSAIYNYYFSFEANKNFIYFKRENKYGNTSISDEEKWKMSVNYKVPEWAKGKIMYHIFVDRFNKGKNTKLEKMDRRIIHESWDEEMKIGPGEDGIWNNDFYGGNLKGITEKLDYIKSLGVSILYLSPIVWSQSNHRYDASDYEKIDPYAGTEQDLKELCDKAHSLGMKVILDAVFNHTGNDSKYFNEFNTFDNVGAYQSKESKYFPFYKTYIDNNEPKFSYWWDMKNMPVCDGKSKAWQDYIYGENGIIDKWFSLGIDGLRLDVADELTDEFIEGIKRAVKRNKEDGFVIGEVWKNPLDEEREKHRNYMSSGKGLDSTMNYHFMDALIAFYKYGKYDYLRDVINRMKVEFPEELLYSFMNFTSTHDISRALSIYAGDFFQKKEWYWDTKSDDRVWQKNCKLSEEELKKGKELYKNSLYTLTFMPGILSIFYGDEIGLTGVGNLCNRRTFPWDKIDHELLDYFRLLGKIRNDEKFLEKASLDIVDINDKILMFERKKDNEEALITVNRTSDEQKILIPKNYEKADKLYRLNDSNEKELNPYGGLVLKKVRR